MEINICGAVINCNFVRLIAAGAFELLPFHLSAKKISTAGADGRVREPSAPNGYKLERFVFDAEIDPDIFTKRNLRKARR